jgi:lincosamide nucleotidyltransferase A/C/D/E
MQEREVIDFYRAMEHSGITVWIDGGWGVDALLGKQTRPHSDLDIAIQQEDVANIRALQESQGYRGIKLEIARPHNFVLGDDKGREIDIHVIALDAKGGSVSV